MKKLNVKEVVVTAAITVLFLAVLRAVLPRVPGLRAVSGLI